VRMETAYGVRADNKSISKTALRNSTSPHLMDRRDATSGLVYVASIVDGGSAEASGVSEVGDVGSFCSLPFGDGLCTRVPDSDGVDFIAGQLESRDEADGYFLCWCARARRRC
jgi:hypothetical protein